MPHISPFNYLPTTVCVTDRLHCDLILHGDDLYYTLI